MYSLPSLSKITSLPLQFLALVALNTFAYHQIQLPVFPLQFVLSHLSDVGILVVIFLSRERPRLDEAVEPARNTRTNAKEPVKYLKKLERIR